METIIRDAFDAVRRQLADYVRKVRGQLKSLDSPPRAKVSRLFPEEDDGFLQTPDGRAIYFHRDSVLREGLRQLGVGTEVTFVEKEGKEGPRPAP